MRDSKIEWTHHTFNPWWGCEKVSPGCTHCYAEAFAKRTGHPVWGGTAPRRFFGDAHWREPLRWDAAAAKAGERHRVFCASMADVFEDRPDVAQARWRLFDLIGRTPRLAWLLLTKRPENIQRFWPVDEDPDGQERGWLVEPGAENVWVGTTVEDEARAGERIPTLAGWPAEVRFLSMEPLLERVDLSGWCERVYGVGVKTAFDWVIVGGESGPGARPCRDDWIRSIVGDCREMGVPVFVKQMGSNLLTGLAGTPPARVRLVDPKGGDWNEWPEDLRVREFPRHPAPSPKGREETT